MTENLQFLQTTNPLLGLGILISLPLNSLYLISLTVISRVKRSKLSNYDYCLKYQPDVDCLRRLSLQAEKT